MVQKLLREEQGWILGHKEGNAQGLQWHCTVQDAAEADQQSGNNNVIVKHYAINGHYVKNGNSHPCQITLSK